MNDDLDQLLTTLRLTKIAQILDEQVTNAESDGLPFRKLLAQLLRAEYHHRQDSALTYRVKKADMPEHWTIESFPFKKQPGVNQRQIRTFAELDFIPKAENIVLVRDRDMESESTSTRRKEFGNSSGVADPKK